MNRGFGRFFAGSVIVAIVVIVFAIYQQRVTPQEIVPTVIPATSISNNLTSIATAQPTPVPTLRVVIPKSNVVAPIIPVFFGANGTWDVAALGRNAGYLEGTPKIGVEGNFVVIGHVELSDGSAGPFANIKMLDVGDQISILGGTFATPLQYVVTARITVKPDAVNEIRNHGFEELTLVTCDDYDFKTNTYLTREIIHARPIQTHQQ